MSDATYGTPDSVRVAKGVTVVGIVSERAKEREKAGWRQGCQATRDHIKSTCNTLFILLV